MNKSPLIFLLAIVSLLFSDTALAYEGRYLAFGLGHSEAKVGNVNYTGVGASILLGAQFNKHLAMEIEYVDFGELVDTTAKVSANSKAISAIFLLPITHRASIYAKLGVAQVSSSLNGAGLTGLRSTISSLPYGLGLQYEMSKKSTLRIFADDGYTYQVNGATTTVTTTNSNSTGGISRIGFSTLYTFD
jgi:hypothetical protein